MKHIKFRVIVLLIFGIVFAFTGIVCADQGVNATPEIQSLGTTTTADVVGLVMETDAGVWTLTNNPSGGPGITVYQYNPSMGADQDAVDYLTAVGASMISQPDGDDWFLITQINIPSPALGLPWPDHPSATYQDFLSDTKSTISIYAIPGASGGIHTGALDPGQVQYTTAYDANIVAQGGHTSFVKQMNLHTGNKVISQSNLNAQTGLTYAATSGGGNVVGSENLMLDGAGMNTTASDKLLCPFAAGIANAIPAYCNIVQAGSMFDLTIGSVTTNANNRFISSDATNPVVLNYDINVKPFSTTQGQVPARGSTSGYIKAHIQEARGNGTTKAEDIQYSDTSSATGTIFLFRKAMGSSSQITKTPGSSGGFHFITGSTGYNAWISPMGSIQVQDHGSVTFTMGEQAGVGGCELTIDGVPLGGGYIYNVYTFSDVTSDHTIVATGGA